MRMYVGLLCVVLLAPAIAAGQEAPPAQPESEGTAIFTEPAALTSGIEFVSPFMVESGRERGNGFYPAMGNLITGAGWLSVGPGYRRWFGGRTGFVDASAEVSWNAYKQAQARMEFPRLAGGRLGVGSQLLWHDLTQVHYFGQGPDSVETQSEFRVKTTDVLGYASYQANAWLAVDGIIGWLDRPTLSRATGWYGERAPEPGVVYPNDPGVGVRPPSYVHGEIAVTADTRDRPGYPSRGGVYRAAMARYADKDLDAFGFRQYQLEAVQFLSVVPHRLTLALHGWTVFTDTAAGQDVPFYMMPSLGGGNTLRGDRNYRWHDRHLLLVNVESRVGVYEHMDVALFVDAGNVAPRFDRLNLDQRSYGVGVRVHAKGSTLVRLDVAHAAGQGWRVQLKLNDPLRLSRLGRRAAAIPFVP